MLSASLGSLAVRKLSASPGLPPPVAAATFASARSRIQQAIARSEATGAAVAVVHRGHIIWEEGFGWANREARLPATPHTPFCMASLTKPFTATALMTLVAEGSLSLDQPANRYLAESRLIGTNGNADAATVRMLGAHASGLPGMYESYDAAEGALAPSPDTLLRAYGRLAYPPGACYEYSNIGYAALNAIASALTQTDFGALLQQRVLDPLGLRDSFFGSDAVRVSEAATPYDPLGHPIAHYTTSTPASGELYASAHDLARFLLFNLRHCLPGQAPILSSQNLDELHRPVFTGPSGVASTFGWFRSHILSGISFLLKVGGQPGVANRMFFIPSQDLGCVVVTNQSNAGDLADSVCDEVITSHLPDWRRPVEDCGPTATDFKPSSETLGKWQGLLENDGAHLPVQLKVLSNAAATLAIGAHRPEELTGIKAEGEAFTAICSGLINSPDAIRTGAKTLQVKLLPRDNRLIGRVFAAAGDPNFKNARLPYVLNLRRS